MTIAAVGRDQWQSYSGPMSVQSFRRLPAQLKSLRLRSGKSQSGFAASVGVDASRWCALERGRRRIASPQAFQDLLTRVKASPEVALELRAALVHDQVLERLASSPYPEQSAELVSCCLQAALVLDKDELNGLIETVRSALLSKENLIALANRAPSLEEVDMT